MSARACSTDATSRNGRVSWRWTHLVGPTPATLISPGSRSANISSLEISVAIARVGNTIILFATSAKNAVPVPLTITQRIGSSPESMYWGSGAIGCASTSRPWHTLNLEPLPHGQASFRPIRILLRFLVMCRSFLAAREKNTKRHVT